MRGERGTACDDGRWRSGRRGPARVPAPTCGAVRPGQPAPGASARGAQRPRAHEPISFRAAVQAKHRSVPHRFLVQRRIEQARALLEARTLPIAEIARSVGFRTPSHFTTTFRRVIGITPSVYRSAGEAEPTKAISVRGVAKRAD